MRRRGDEEDNVKYNCTNHPSNGITETQTQLLSNE